MKLYEVQATEYNGEQEYSNSHLLAAKDVNHARKLARKFFEKWYEDGDDSHADPDDPDKFEFIGGCIILKIDRIAETTLEDWKERQVQLYSIGSLPKEKTSSKRCSIPIAVAIKEQRPDYCKAAEYLADQGRKIFTGSMKGGLWNARCMDACILSKKQDDKAAYEFLLKFGDQYVQGLPESQKSTWQQIKDSADALLKPDKSCDAANKNTQ